MLWLIVHTSNLPSQFNNNAISKTCVYSLVVLARGIDCIEPKNYQMLELKIWCLTQTSPLPEAVWCLVFKKIPGSKYMRHSEHVLKICQSWFRVSFLWRTIILKRCELFLSIHLFMPTFISRASSGQRCPQQVLRRSGLPLEGSSTGVGSTDF